MCYFKHMNSLIYILKSSQGYIVKIGETTVSADARREDYIANYLLEGDYSTHKVYHVRNDKRKAIERKVHEKLRNYRISGISGARELFECSTETAENIIEETIKELQPSLFIELYETGKLDITAYQDDSQTFFETKMILEFLKIDNFSVYNFCNKIKVTSNPNESPLAHQNQLPISDLLFFNSKFQFEDIVIDHNSNPNISDLIEQYLMKEKFKNVYEFKNHLIKKIYKKVHQYEKLIKDASEEYKNFSKVLDQISNLDTGRIEWDLSKSIDKTTREMLEEKKIHIRVLEDIIYHRKERYDVLKHIKHDNEENKKNITQLIHKLKQEKHKLKQEKQDIKVVLNRLKNQLNQRKSNIEKLLARGKKHIKSLTIPIHIILTFLEKVNFRKLIYSNSPVIEKFISCFFKEYSKLNSVERSLIMNNCPDIIRIVLYEFYMNNYFDTELKEMIKQEITKNGLQDFLIAMLPTPALD